MNLGSVARNLGLENLTPELGSNNQTMVIHGHASDLLSDVLGHAPPGSVLVTIQVHMNVVAVAVHAGLAGVIFASGRRPNENVRIRAVTERMPLFLTSRPTFDVVGELYRHGLRGEPC